MTKGYALHLLNQLMIGASVDAKPIIPQYELAQALDLAIKALEQQPCEDCVSRSELQKTMDSLPLFRFVNNDHEEADDYYNCESVDMVIRNLPSVTPKYSDEEIDKAQAVEQAYVDKMVELAVKESRREWLNSFDTSSATKCFEAVNLLKQRLEGEE